MINFNSIKKLNSTQIKLIALFTMLLDHIHYYISPVLSIPIWFRWLGRISAPLFIFMVAEGVRYTKNIKAYLLRLYIGFIFMNIFNFVIMKYVPNPNYITITNNIFGTLFLIVFYSVCFLSLSPKNRNYFKPSTAIIFLVISVLINYLSLSFDISIGNYMPYEIIPNIFPCLYFVEGGFMFVLLGIFICMLRDNRKVQLIFYSLFSLFLLFQLIKTEGFDLNYIFNINYQWLMVFAIVPMLMYNTEKGKGLKYLFYVFYPVHIYLLYLISCVIQ